MTGKKHTGKAGRLYFLDNLKVFIIFLVIVFHAGYVYESGGFLSFLWIVDDPSKNDLAGIINLILDMFMMPTLFFISGYFAPMSLRSQKGFAFLRSRFKRLMVPWIIAILTLIPFYKLIFLVSRNLPQEQLVSYFHFSGEIMLNQGWLWFLPVLFLFDTLYFLLSKVVPTGFRPNLKLTVIAVFLISVGYSFSMSYWGLSGWTKTVLLDFQNERLLIYFMLFILGSQLNLHHVFSTTPGSRKLYYLANATIWIPMNLYVVFVLNLIFKPGSHIISRIGDLVVLWTSFHLSVLGLLFILINTFRYFLNRKGRLSTALGQYSYGVYIIHFIVMGAIAMLLLNVSLSSTAKLAVLSISTFVACNLILLLYKGASCRLSKRAGFVVVQRPIQGASSRV